MIKEYGKDRDRQQIQGAPSISRMQMLVQNHDNVSVQYQRPAHAKLLAAFSKLASRAALKPSLLQRQNLQSTNLSLGIDSR
jgi:hypothetical protein